MTDKHSALEIVNEILAFFLLIFGGAMVATHDAPLMAIIVVGVIVVCGVAQWFNIRKLGKEARVAGTWLLLLLGATLTVLPSFWAGSGS